MDANVPAYITKPEVLRPFLPFASDLPRQADNPQDVDPYTDATNDKALQAQMRELVCYIWDNYLQLYDSAPEIFLMGVGNAYLGVKMLLISRGKFRSRPSLPSLPTFN